MIAKNVGNPTCRLSGIEKKMIPISGVILVAFEILQIGLQYLETIHHNDEEEDLLDEVMLVNVIYLLNILLECMQMLIHKEQLDLLQTKKIHKLLKYLHGYQ